VHLPTLTRAPAHPHACSRLLARLHRLADDYRTVYYVIHSSPTPLTATSIAAATNIPLHRVRFALRQLRQRTKITRYTSWHSQHGYTWVYAATTRTRAPSPQYASI